MTKDGFSSQTLFMFLFDFFKFRYRIARVLPAGNYEFIHVFGQKANGRQIKGSLQIPNGPFSSQIAALAYTLDLEADCLAGAKVDELDVNTYLKPFCESQKDFRKEILQLATIGVFSTDGFETQRYFGGDRWTFRDTSYCDSWLIELNQDGP